MNKGFDSTDFRRTLATFATGITVVTSVEESGVHGMTANSFASVSLDPPLVLVSVDKKSHTHELIAKTQMFGVSILRRDQEVYSRHFAGKPDPHLHPKYNWIGEVPVLSDCLSWLACRVWSSYEGGDHTIYVGEVFALGVNGGEPLIFFGSAYRELKSAE